MTRHLVIFLCSITVNLNPHKLQNKAILGGKLLEKLIAARLFYQVLCEGSAWISLPQTATTHSFCGYDIEQDVQCSAQLSNAQGTSAIVQFTKTKTLCPGK